MHFYFAFSTGICAIFFIYLLFVENFILIHQNCWFLLASMELELEEIPLIYETNAVSEARLCARNSYHVQYNSAFNCLFSIFLPFASIESKSISPSFFFQFSNELHFYFDLTWGSLNRSVGWPHSHFLLFQMQLFLSLSLSKPL